MKRGFIAYSDEELAYCEITNDLLFHKIPKEKLDYYIKESIGIGKEVAIKLQGKDIYKLIEESNIKLNIKDKKSVIGGVMLRGEFNYSKKDQSTITLYNESIESIVENFNKEMDDRFKLDVDKFKEVHLAHEYFHYLEYSSGSLVSDRLESIKVSKILGFSRYAKVLKCSEIAAHSFSKYFCRLNIFPNMYDYLYLIYNKKSDWEYIEKLINKYKEKTK